MFSAKKMQIQDPLIQGAPKVKGYSVTQMVSHHLGYGVTFHPYGCQDTPLPEKRETFLAAEYPSTFGAPESAFFAPSTELGEIWLIKCRKQLSLCSSDVVMK